MIARRCKDSRMGYWPKVTTSNGKVVLSGKILTPARLCVMKECLFKPLHFVWQLAVFALIVEGVFYIFGTSYRNANPIGYYRWLIYLLMGGSVLLWQFEQFSGYLFTRLLMGKRLRIKIFSDRLTVGGWLFRRRFLREQRLMFAVRPFERSISPFYQHSQGLYIVIGDSRQVKLAEIFDFKKGGQFVSNANMALQLGEESPESDLDVDPTRNPHVI